MHSLRSIRFPVLLFLTLAKSVFAYETNTPPIAPKAYTVPTNAVLVTPIALPPSPAPLTSDFGTPGPSLTFDAYDGVGVPPDTQGAVGPNHVVTMDNDGVFYF